MKLLNSIAFAALAGATSLACADQLTITLHAVDANGIGKIIGTVQAADGRDGLVLTPNLSGLTPGQHGFHVHEKADCGPTMKDDKMGAAMAAGGHFDPDRSGKHAGPAGHGHRGDLPALVVSPAGLATQAVTAPHLKVADLHGHALMIHAGGDNYSDQPKPLGGGGARVACGVIDGR